MEKSLKTAAHDSAGTNVLGYEKIGKQPFVFTQCL